MILLAEHDEPSLAAKKKRQPSASSRPTSTPKNRVWGFENSPSGRPSVDPQLTQETATGSVQYTYQIASGRAEWLSRDPIAERGGINLYDYVANNPMDRIDPMGLTWGDDASMTGAWATGQAPPTTFYGPGTNQANDMMQAPGIQQAIQFYNNKNQGNCPGNKQGVDNFPGHFGLKGLWNAGTNSTQQFVGSYDIEIVPSENNTVTVVVTNTTSVTSLLYGLYPNALNPPNGYPMGNATQVIYWTQPDTSGSGTGGCGGGGGGNDGGGYGAAGDN